MNDLVKVDNLQVALLNIQKTLAEVDDLKEALGLRNLAKGFEEAWKAHYRTSGFGEEQMKLGWEAKVRAERRMGEMLKAKVRAGNPQLLHGEIIGLDELGISATQSHRYQQLTKANEDKFNKAISNIIGIFGEPTTKALLSSLVGAHVGQNTGEFEWYTPPQYIEAARLVMGKIDLDPASSEIANELVKAEKFFTVKDDGLKQEWFGNVWMNPPYSQPLIDNFCAKLVSEYRSGRVKQACVLVNNATETAWGQRLLEDCSSVCFPKGRIRFVDKEGNLGGTPLQGQVVVYFGKNAELFETTFKKFGKVLWKEAKLSTGPELDK